MKNWSSGYIKVLLFFQMINDGWGKMTDEYLHQMVEACKSSLKMHFWTVRVTDLSKLNRKVKKPKSRGTFH